MSEVNPLSVTKTLEIEVGANKVHIIVSAKGSYICAARGAFI